MKSHRLDTMTAVMINSECCHALRMGFSERHERLDGARTMLSGLNKLSEPLSRIILRSMFGKVFS